MSDESISTWYFKRTMAKTPSGSQVSYSYKSAKARDSISSSYRPSYGTRTPSHRPDISTYRRRKYPGRCYYQTWYVIDFNFVRLYSFLPFVTGTLILFTEEANV